MSIKTHYALDQAGETDNAKFPSALHSGGATLQSVGPTCKFYHPCTETSGTDITDPVGGVVTDVSDGGDTIDFTPDYAITVENNATAAPSSGTMPVIGTAATIVLLIAKKKDNTSAIVTYGTVGNDYLQVFPNKTSGLTQSVASWNTDSLDDSVSDTIAVASIFQGDGTLRHYRDGVYTDSYTMVADIVDFQNNNVLIYGTGSVTPDIYGHVLFQFSSMPSDGDITTALQWMKTQWVAGNKSLYPGWVSKAAP